MGHSLRPEMRPMAAMAWGLRDDFDDIKPPPNITHVERGLILKPSQMAQSCAVH